jgi:deoxyribonuclease V
LKLIGAVDISYSKDDDRKGIAYLLVCEYPSFKIVYEDSIQKSDIDFPYIPGFLAFKEIPLYDILFQRLKT